jgi:cytochrome c biogenesis protein CcmG, thiol:disulfide interchange protein DsbE
MSSLPSRPDASTAASPGSAGGARGDAKTGSRARLPLIALAALAFSFLLIGAGLLLLLRERQSSVPSVELGAPASQAQAAVESGQALPKREQSQAPDFILTAIDGSQVKLSDLRGKVVLLNFWATWCPPCKAEMPDLNALHQQYGSQRGFMVIAIDAGDDSPEAVKAFAQQYGLDFPLLLDPGDQVSDGLYTVRALPTSLLIDRQGKIHSQWLGQLSKSEMLTRLGQVW